MARVRQVGACGRVGPREAGGVAAGPLVNRGGSLTPGKINTQTLKGARKDRSGRTRTLGCTRLIGAKVEGT